MGARLRDIASGRRDALNIDPKLIKIEPGYNPRQYTLFENRQHLDQLKLSIAQVGVLQPLLARWDGEQAVLIDGECRLRACLELIKEGVEIKTVPVLQETASDEASRLLLSLATNTGKPFSVLELGAAYKRLSRHGWSNQEIAEKSGTTTAKVAQAIELAEAPTDVKELVTAGSVTPSLARQVVREKGDKAGADLRAKVSQAKAAGKKKATREKSEGKVAKDRKAEKAQIDYERELGDSMAEAIVGNPDLADTSLFRMARKWKKLRGIA